jgi:hypothetical protein
MTMTDNGRYQRSKCFQYRRSNLRCWLMVDLPIFNPEWPCLVVHRDRARRNCDFHR